MENVRRGGAALGRGCAECAEVAAKAVRAMPVFLSNFLLQNCGRWSACLAVVRGCLWEQEGKCERFVVVGDFEGRRTKLM
jgi:hypothetical protein